MNNTDQSQNNCDNSKNALNAFYRLHSAQLKREQVIDKLALVGLSLAALALALVAANLLLKTAKELGLW